MSIRHLFEPFMLTPIDHAGPDLFVSNHLSFSVADQNKAIEAISRGISHLASCIPFITGEVRVSTLHSGPENVLEVCPSIVSPAVPLLQIRFHPGHRLPERSMHAKSSISPHTFLPAIPWISCDPLPRYASRSQPQPVVRFQANVLADGIVLSMIYNHLVFDGTGASTIFELLADLMGATGSVEHTVSTARATFIQEAYLRKFVFDPSASSKLESKGLEMFSRAYSKPSSASPDTPPPETSEELLVFSGDKISALKEACTYVLTLLREQMPESLLELAHSSFVSSNDVVTAMLFLSICKARHAVVGFSNQPIEQRRRENCQMAVNLRAKFSPSLPRTYLGNAATPLRLSVTSPGVSDARMRFPDLSRHLETVFGLSIETILPLAHLAYQIRNELTNFDATYVRNLMSFLGKHPDMRPAQVDIAVSSWRHLTMYSLDFGPTLGQINQFDGSKNLPDGTCIILPAGDGGLAYSVRAKVTSGCAPWAVQVSLRPPVMEMLKRDGLFCWASEEEKA